MSNLSFFTFAFLLYWSCTRNAEHIRVNAIIVMHKVYANMPTKHCNILYNLPTVLTSVRVPYISYWFNAKCRTLEHIQISVKDTSFFNKRYIRKCIGKMSTSTQQSPSHTLTVYRFINFPINVRSTDPPLSHVTLHVNKSILHAFTCFFYQPKDPQTKMSHYTLYTWQCTRQIFLHWIKTSKSQIQFHASTVPYPYILWEVFVMCWFTLCFRQSLLSTWLTAFQTPQYMSLVNWTSTAR